MTASAPSSSRASGETPDAGVARAHRGLTILFLVLGVVQFFLAGLGAFGESFDAHRGVGSLMVVLALVLVLLAFAGRRAALQSSAVLFGLMVLQSVLAVVGAESSSLVGALHAVNALLILFVASKAAAGRRVALPGR